MAAQTVFIKKETRAQDSSGFSEVHIWNVLSSLGLLGQLYLLRRYGGVNGQFTNSVKVDIMLIFSLINITNMVHCGTYSANYHYQVN